MEQTKNEPKNENRGTNDFYNNDRSAYNLYNNNRGTNDFYNNYRSTYFRNHN